MSIPKTKQVRVTVAIGQSIQIDEQYLATAKVKVRRNRKGGGGKCVVVLTVPVGTKVIRIDKPPHGRASCSE